MSTFYGIPNQLTSSSMSPVTRTVVTTLQPNALLTTQPSLGITTPFVTTVNNGVVIGPRPTWPGMPQAYGASIGSYVSGYQYPGYVPIGRTIISAGNPYYYDDSGIGDNPLAQYDISKEIRLEFLDSWLYEDRYSNILRKLIVQNGKVIVASVEEEKKNDISKDSEKDLLAKSDFIGDEILSIGKVQKLLTRLVIKNNIKFYDIPHSHNKKYVKKTIAEYVVDKIKEMQK